MTAGPAKIEMKSNGAYVWSCSIDVNYYRKNMRTGFHACLIIAALLLLLGGVFSYRVHDLEVFWIVAGCTAVFLAITCLVFWLYTHFAKDPQERYEMTEEYVKTGVGKYAVYFSFKKAKIAVFTKKYIELRGRTAKMRVYSPEKDFDFVRSFIMNRLTGDCDIRYE